MNEKVTAAERAALAAESALVGRLRDFANGGQLAWGDEDLAADTIIRLRRQIEAEGKRIAVAEGTIAEVRVELDGLMSSLDDHVIADDTERENVWAAIQAVWSVLPRAADYDAANEAVS